MARLTVTVREKAIGRLPAEDYQNVVAHAFGVHPSTISLLVHRFQTTGTIPPPPLSHPLPLTLSLFPAPISLSLPSFSLPPPLSLSLSLTHSLFLSLSPSVFLPPPSLSLWCGARLLHVPCQREYRRHVTASHQAMMMQQTQRGRHTRRHA